MSEIYRNYDELLKNIEVGDICNFFLYNGALTTNKEPLIGITGEISIVGDYDFYIKNNKLQLNTNKKITSNKYKHLLYMSRNTFTNCEGFVLTKKENKMSNQDSKNSVFAVIVTKDTKIEDKTKTEIILDKRFVATSMENAKIMAVIDSQILPDKIDDYNILVREF